MKFVTWNCNGAFRKKYHALEEFGADILVIQECEDPSRSTIKYREWAGDYLWVGENKNKGIGIFSKNGCELEALNWNDNGLQSFLPCRVDDSVNLIGVWTKQVCMANYQSRGNQGLQFF
jgi:exonuclease III